MESHERLHQARPTAATIDTALVVLRVALGIVFVAHGGQKLFWFGIAGTTSAFADMGIFLPSLTAPAVAVVEFFGGIALLLGLFTRIAATGIAIVMLGAILMVHLSAGFFAPDGFEFPMMNLAVAVALALMGPGAHSLDAKRVANRKGTGAETTA